ncbi:hypothetical protein AB0G15_31125 [Streptosporangium sp. NPDC023825]|uniref:hypothetical protein n=1 Tax=Streptosporangium sp. NPDC023825 TaxID=3154909 RepID=UPI003433B008
MTLNIGFSPDKVNVSTDINMDVAPFRHKAIPEQTKPKEGLLQPAFPFPVHGHS